MRSLAILFLVAACAPLTACVNTDASIFVVPTIGSPAATVKKASPLATVLTGAFTLGLHLGPRADGESTVTLGEFSILDAAMTTPIVTPLDVTGDMMFPLIVLPGSDATTNFTFDLGPKTLTGDEVTALCAAAGVVIGGAIDDSLSGNHDPVYSAVFKPSECP